jgi:hypothetical protein
MIQCTGTDGKLMQEKTAKIAYTCTYVSVCLTSYIFLLKIRVALSAFRKLIIHVKPNFNFFK